MSKPTGRGGRRTPPYVFTEQGVAMLSSVLGSKRAIQVNILIMRAFVRLREMMALYREEVGRKINDLENLCAVHDVDIKRIFACIRELMRPKSMPRNRQIGFVPPKEK
jgi:hypothetical protein